MNITLKAWSQVSTLAAMFGSLWNEPQWSSLAGIYTQFLSMSWTYGLHSNQGNPGGGGGGKGVISMIRSPADVSSPLTILFCFLPGHSPWGEPPVPSWNNLDGKVSAKMGGSHSCLSELAGGSRCSLIWMWLKLDQRLDHSLRQCWAKRDPTKPHQIPDRSVR